MDASLRGKSVAVATAFNVTPAQAASASKSISPEHADNPSPPVAGCNPASTIALPVSILQVTPSPSFDFAFSVIRAASGSDLYLFFRGSCNAFSSFEFITYLEFDQIQSGYFMYF